MDEVALDLGGEPSSMYTHGSSTFSLSVRSSTDRIHRSTLALLASNAGNRRRELGVPERRVRGAYQRLLIRVMLEQNRQCDRSRQRVAHVEGVRYSPDVLGARSSDLDRRSRCAERGPGGGARSDENARWLVDHGTEPVEVSLFDEDALTVAFGGCEAVANLASALPATSQFIFPWAWRRNHRVRVDGSRAVANAAIAAGVEVLVQESVAMLYPDGGTAWITRRRHARAVLDRRGEPGCGAERNTIHRRRWCRRGAPVRLVLRLE